MKSLAKFTVALGRASRQTLRRPLACVRSDTLQVAGSSSSRFESGRTRTPPPRSAKFGRKPCDYVANAYGFVPNTEFAALLGCKIENGAVKVNASQQTSVANIYCAGETTGIGGVDTALLEGQIAAGASNCNPKLRKAKSFARRLNETFRPHARTPQSCSTRNGCLPLRRRNTGAFAQCQFLAFRQNARTLRHGSVPRPHLRTSHTVYPGLGAFLSQAADLSNSARKFAPGEFC